MKLLSWWGIALVIGIVLVSARADDFVPDPSAAPYLYVPANDSEVINLWQNIMFDRIRENACSPPTSARNYMMLHVAGLDAAIDARKHFGSNVEASHLAVQSAYRTIISHLYQDKQAAADEVMHYQVSQFAPCQMVNDAIDVGYNAAMDLIQRRLRDGSIKFFYYTPKNDTCDYWVPTSGKPFWAAQYGVAKPYSMINHRQFRQGSFPKAGTHEFEEDIRLTNDYGAKTGSNRTEEDSQIALYWSDGPGTYTPAGHWNTILHTVVSSEEFNNLSLVERTRAFALMNIAMYDAAIACWDMKLHYDRWRPVTAINNGGSWCPGSGLVDDPTWESFLYTPDFPDYVSGHSTFSAAAAAVLSNVLCSDNFTFSVVSDEDKTTVRTFNSFSEAAYEASWSRVLGGIHFESASLHGRGAGKVIGEFIVATEYTDPSLNTAKCNLHFGAPSFDVAFCPTASEE